jgi:ubiquinone/menaquinone biosynthesis C-methylase UbiE
MSIPSAPSPALFMDALNAYQRTAVLRAAIELGVFTAIGAEPAGAAAIAERCQASERGIRSLCDYLTVLGFLTKEAAAYRLTQDSAIFLDRRSPAYVGGAVEFMLNPGVVGGFAALTEAVKKGGTAISPLGSVAPEHPMWVDFARAMGPIMHPMASAIPEMLPFEADRPLKVLDVAAGHGVYGIHVARRFPKAQITALDWSNVLEVAQENARAAGIADRYSILPGSAFDVDFGSGYDLVLLTSFLHHFDPPACEAVLRKARGSLADGGLVATVEMVPDPDRVSPAQAVAFSVIMLATTPAGDAYTFEELEGMAKRAGFSRTEERPLAGPANKVLFSYP